MATQKRFSAKNGLDNNNATIVNVANPVNAQDVATKNFSTNASNLASGTVPTARLGSGTADSTTYLRGDGSWSAVASSNSVAFTVKTAAYNLVNNDNIAANTTAGAFTLTLPASPTAGTMVRVIDYAGTFDTYNLTIARNGSNIMGVAQDLICDTENLQVVLDYVDATQGWKFLMNSGASNYTIIQDHNPLNTLTNIPYTVKTAAYNLVAGDNIAANTTAGAFTLTLPAAPTAGDLIRIVDYAGTFNTYNLTIARNGKNILGAAEDLVCNTKNISFILTFIDNTQGWRII